ncbi:hypothetical protein [Bacillus canaveralius]|nr:hypothetical protein [Bacillus canaveralius]
MEQIWNCSECSGEISDEREFIDNGGICDDCYSTPFRQKIASKKPTVGG